ncbi:hypothetical protein [Mucilaginibacter ginsenosidivorax]|uniref:Uncharacterized protein n=1 Tax=Mucilaginibacter ginsenosidivorax TaxID=862126 RepID=A0A5B8W0M9_9SPHI|nr:hypothetical protein [Mucilaginibacter ginsenosidivorax]QEC75768.1 hypothetical protein FSB76_07305 [Mucilaginibacter ginsenosidivorax]
MSKFYRESLERQELIDDNILVTVKKTLKLIENSEFYKELVALFKIDEQSNESIPILGLNKLINSIIYKDGQYEKFDFPVNLCDVSLNRFTDSGSIILNILIDKSEVQTEKSKILLAETAYNAKSDYFESAYKLDQFAKFCFKERHTKLLQDNIRILNEHYQNSNDYNRNFRVLKTSDGEYFVRAITSTTHYNNYGIRFALFTATLSLKNLMTTQGWEFRVNRAEYDESHIKVFFEKVGTKFIKGIGTIKYIIEMSNDEIKREAMKFSAVYSILSEDYEIYVKPEKLKTELISIQHNFNPSTVFAHLSTMNEFITKSESEIMEDIGELNNINNPDELRYLLLRKVELTKNNEIKQERAGLTKLLQVKINTISELLSLMGKVDLIVSDLETKEYLRYLFYDVLNKRK